MLVIAAMTAQAPGYAQHVQGVIYADQPTGIDSGVFVSKWPSLEQYIDLIHDARRAEALHALRERARSTSITDGELNLLAQLEWQHGDLNAADAAVDRAVAMAPNEPLHAFQRAMVSFAHLRASSGFMERWSWQRKTRDAYARVFELDPGNVSARYYLAYSYMNTPSIGGGDTAKALSLADGGIALNQYEFYAVRADAHRLRGEREAAALDYDAAIALKVIKLGGFLDAGADALERGELERARKYYEWAAYCRADASGPFEGLGDYYLAIKDYDLARQNYETALQKDPSQDAVKRKLDHLRVQK
jgi:tetratricopeptide (TPR) repeat protein